MKNKMLLKAVTFIMMLGFMVGIAVAQINIPQEKYQEQMSVTGVINGELSFVFSKKGVADITKSFKGYGTCENIYSNDSGTYILTAFHCIDYEGLVPLVKEWAKTALPGWSYKSHKLELSVQYTANGPIYKDIKILAGDKNRDVVLLFTESLKNQKYLTLKSPEIKIGDELYCVVTMYNDPILKIVNFGKITYFEHVDLNEGWVDQILVTGMFQPGNSGGGVFDKDGYVIGIVHGAHSKTFGTSIGIVTSAKSIIKVLIDKGYEFILKR